jgi:hypothetical protein
MFDDYDQRFWMPPPNPHSNEENGFGGGFEEDGFGDGYSVLNGDGWGYGSAHGYSDGDGKGSIGIPLYDLHIEELEIYSVMIGDDLEGDGVGNGQIITELSDDSGLDWLE